MKSIGIFWGAVAYGLLSINNEAHNLESLDPCATWREDDTKSSSSPPPPQTQTPNSLSHKSCSDANTSLNSVKNRYIPMASLQRYEAARPIDSELVLDWIIEDETDRSACHLLTTDEIPWTLFDSVEAARKQRIKPITWTIEDICTYGTTTYLRFVHVR